MDAERLRVTITAEDVLVDNDREYRLLLRAQSGDVLCPWGCGRPLSGTFYFVVGDGYQDKGVRLKCGGCGFTEC